MKDIFLNIKYPLVFCCFVAAAFLVSCARAPEGQEVRFTVAYYSAKSGPIFEEAARAFEAANDGITVKVEVVNWDNLLQKLTTDISAGTNSDIAIIGTRWLLDFVDQDVVEPLDSYMTAELRDRFIGNFLAPSVLDGQTYGLPVAASARAMYYNNDLFAQAGIEEVPQTWDDLYFAAEQISALPDVYGFGLQGKEIETDAYWYYALWSFGGDIVVDGASGIASPAAVDAANFYQDMIALGYTQPGVTDYSRENLQDLFKQGRLGMMLTGPWMTGQLKEEAPDVDFGIALIPEGARRATYGVTDSIVLFKNSKNKEAAFKFLDFIFQEEWRSRFTKDEGFLPVHKAVAADPYFSNDPNLQAFSGMLPYAHFAPTIKGWEEAADITSNALQRIYQEQGDTAEILLQAAEQVNGIIQ